MRTSLSKLVAVTVGSLAYSLATPAAAHAQTVTGQSITGDKTQYGGGGPMPPQYYYWIQAKYTMNGSNPPHVTADWTIEIRKKVAAGTTPPPPIYTNGGAWSVPVTSGSVTIDSGKVTVPTPPAGGDVYEMKYTVTFKTSTGGSTTIVSTGPYTYTLTP